MESTAIAALAIAFNVSLAASHIQFVELAIDNVKAFNRSTIERCKLYNQLEPGSCELPAISANYEVRQ